LPLMFSLFLSYRIHIRRIYILYGRFSTFILPFIGSQYKLFIPKRFAVTACLCYACRETNVRCGAAYEL
ncbi:MAG: hypothetical protein ABI690_33285, partial [Chloroflexota bacterium]